MSDEQAGQQAGKTRLVSLWVDQLPPDERKAVHAAIDAGKQFGYGNIVAHVRRAWKAQMMNSYDFPDDDALTSQANRAPYPIDDRQRPEQL